VQQAQAFDALQVNMQRPLTATLPMAGIWAELAKLTLAAE
jgi:hypothetical protein